MYFPKNNILKSYFVFSVFLSSPIIALGETTGEKKLDLRIGFDLTQESNGAPSLRIRDFEDSSELTPRAKDEFNESPKPAPVIRADSFSDSDENASEDDTSKQAENRNRKSDNDDEYDNSGDDNKVRSTKGLNPAEYEPEAENLNLHAKYKGQESSESDSFHHKKIVRHYKKKINKPK